VQHVLAENTIERHNIKVTTDFEAHFTNGTNVDVDFAVEIERPAVSTEKVWILL